MGKKIFYGILASFFFIFLLVAVWYFLGGSSQPKQQILVLYSSRELEYGNKTLLFQVGLTIGEDTAIFSAARIGPENLSSSILENTSREFLLNYRVRILVKGPHSGGRYNRIVVCRNNTIIIEGKSDFGLALSVDRLTLALAKPYVLGLRKGDEGILWLAIIKPGGSEGLMIRWLSQMPVEYVESSVPIIDESGNTLSDLELALTMLGKLYVTPW